MSTRSRKIRAERREKMAMRWPDTKKLAGSRVHGELAKDSRIGVGCKKDDPPLAEGASSQGVSSSLS